MARRHVISSATALLGIVCAAAIAWSASQLAGQHIGLASAPLSAGAGLAPTSAASTKAVKPPAARTQGRHGGERRSSRQSAPSDRAAVASPVARSHVRGAGGGTGVVLGSGTAPGGSVPVAQSAPSSGSSAASAGTGGSSARTASSAGHSQPGSSSGSGSSGSHQPGGAGGSGQRDDGGSSGGSGGDGSGGSGAGGRSGGHGSGGGQPDD